MDREQLIQLIQQAVEAMQAGLFDLARKNLLEALSIAHNQGDRLMEIKALHELANLNMQLGNYFEAEKAADRSLAIAQAISDPTLIYKSLYNLGLSRYWQEEYDRAIAAYQEALKYIDINNPDCWIIWNSLGETYYWQENYGKAIKAHDLALALASSNTRKSTSQFNLGQTYYWAGNYPQAIACLQASFNLDTENPRKITILSTLGQIYIFTKQWGKAEEFLEGCLVLEREANNISGIISTLNFLVQVKLELNRLEMAEKLANEAVILAESSGQLDALASALTNLASVQSRRSKFEQAIAIYNRALEIVRQLADRTQIIIISMSLFGIYERQGRYTKAISYCVEALKIAESPGDLSIAQLALKNLGQVYLSLGNYKIAIAYIEKYLAVAQNDGDPTTDIAPYQMLGNACRSCGEYDRAISSFQSALSLATNQKNIDEQVQALTNLATVYRSLLKYKEAGDYLNQGLALVDRITNPTVKGNLLFECISLLTLEGNPQAIALCHELLKLSKQTLAYPEHLVWQILADAHSRMGEHDRAIAALLKAKPLIESQVDELLKGEILNALGKAYLQANRYQEAEVELTRAIAVWEDLRKQLGSSNFGSRDRLQISFLTKQRITYQLLLQALVSQNKFDAALENSELGRARSLSDILNENNPDLSDRSTTQITIEQIKQLAQALNATLVEYAETLEALYIWVITPDGEINFRSVSLVNPWAVMTDAASGVYPGSELNQAVADLRAAMNISQSLLRKFIAIDNLEEAKNPSNKQDWKTALQKIYQFTIEPIKQYLPQNALAKVIFIPQGYLFNVPFSALMNTSGEYLIQHHTIATVPSIKILQLISQNENSPINSDENTSDSVLVVGNPIMPNLSKTLGYYLSPLSGAEREAKTIARIFEVSPLIGEDATKTRVVEQMPTANIIHLATHGLLDYGVSESSLEGDILGAIALAPDNNPNLVNDGLLTAQEIANMSLKADLTVLSACHTGRGDITADGVIGLSRALTVAGVSRIMVSLWAIPDTPTATLMENFYLEIKQGTNKSQSLREAMLKAIADEQKPVNWAAFTLIGL